MPNLQIVMTTKSTICAETFNCLLPLLNKTISNYTVFFNNMSMQSNSDQAKSILLSKWYDASKSDDVILFIDPNQVFAYDDIKKMLNLLKKVDVVISDKLLLIKHSILPDIAKIITSDLKLEFKHKYNNPNMISNDGHIWLSERESKIIPFFAKHMVYNNNTQWLDNNYTFLYLVHLAGGNIQEYKSNTIGMITYDILYLS